MRRSHPARPSAVRAGHAGRLRAAASRRFALVASVMLTATVAAAGPAHAASGTTNLRCTLPNVGTSSLALSPNFADSFEAGKEIRFAPTASALFDPATLAALRGEAGEEVDGTASVVLKMSAPSWPFPTTVRFTLFLDRRPLPTDPVADLVLGTVGPNVAIGAPDQGPVVVTLDSLSLDLRVSAPGGLFPEGADRAYRHTGACTPATPGEGSPLATIPMTPSPLPRVLTVDGITKTGATFCWSGYTRTDGQLAGLPEGIVVVNSETTIDEPFYPGEDGCATVAGLQPGTAYWYEVAFRNPDTGAIWRGTEPLRRFDTLPPSPQGCPAESGGSGPRVDHAYGMAGAAALKTLVRGSLPLSGLLAAQLTTPSNCLSGDLTLQDTAGSLTALGFLPVSARVQLVPTAKVTGQLQRGVLSANAKVRIKLAKVTLFGIQLAGGVSCQAKQITSVDLKSTQATFDPAVGGPIAGTFTISDLTGCGALTGIVSPLTAGPGNAILLNLAPKG